MEEQLPAGLREGQIAEFVESDEVHPGEVIGDASLTPGARFRLQPIDEIDDIEEAPTQAGADAAARDGDGEMGLAGSRAADENDVALLRHEAAAGEIARQGFVDGRPVKLEVVDVLRQRKFGDGHLIFDGARLFFGDFGLE